MNAINDVGADSKMNQACQQDVYVAAAIQHSWTISHSLQVVVEPIHVLARQEENDYQYQTKD
jgi:hypothetical protein